MNRSRCISAIAAVLSLTGAVCGGEAKEGELRVALDLIDGSRIVGSPAASVVAVQTSYARMDVQLEKIRSIKIDSDHKAASLDMVNGDKLKGELSLKSVELTTVFGKVSAGIEHINNIQVSIDKVLPGNLKDGLVLHYSFDKDENGVVTDKSGRKHDGKVHGSKWTEDGKVGGAYRLGGSDYIDIGYQPAGTQLTLAAWIKASNKQVGFFLGTHYVESSLWMLTVEGPHGPPRQCARIGYNTGSDGEALYGTSNVQDGRWHHIAATIDSTGARIYVDGVMENKNSVPGKWKGANAAIGRSLTGSPGFYSGLIDEVMIYDRALSEQEIRYIHDAQK